MPSETETGERVMPASRSERLASSDGPRFDLRFEAGRGLLRLARVLSAGAARVVALELSLGNVRFPVDVTEGPLRFRTRRTVLRSARVLIDPRELVRWAAGRGVRLEIASPLDGGAFAVAMADEVGTIAFDAVVVADGADLLIAAERVRVATDGPATPWTRIDRMARKLGLELDVERGAWRAHRPVRRILARALVARGWRLPDERAVSLGPPRLTDGSFVLELGRLLAGGRMLLDEARLLAPVAERLVAMDLAGASDRIDALVRRLDARPGAEDSVREHVKRLACAVAVERAGHETDAIRAAEGSDDPAMLAVGLRAALRVRDLRLSIALAERIAVVDPVPSLAAEALLAAAELVGQADPSRARELITRAVARRPADTALLLRCIDLAELGGDASAIEELARRALSSPIAPHERARIATAAARALEHSGSRRDSREGVVEHATRATPVHETAEELYAEALAAAPDDPDAIAGLGAARARRGDRDAAIARFDRAAELYGLRGADDAAARMLMRAGELLAGSARLAAAEQRLERAVFIADSDAAIVCALARVRARLGALSNAATAYQMLLGAGARATAALPAALVEAAAFHLDELRDPDAAAPFVHALARLCPKGDARVVALEERLAAARGSSDRGPRLTTGGTADIDALLDAVERHRVPGDARDDAVRAAVDVARGSSDPGAAGRLAERLAQIDRLPGDVALLEDLERLAIDPLPRGAIARAISHALRADGRGGEAALALARAGMILNDAATLRAALDIAERSAARAEALEVVAIALDVVGEGPARAALLARRAELSRRAGDED